MMTFLRYTFFVFLTLSMFGSQAQDSLLLTNGKIRNLKGVVVFYDHDEVLYQNDRQRKRMKKYVSRKEAKSQKNSVIKRAQRKLEKVRKKEEKKQANQLKKLTQLRLDFEADVKIKLERLSPADFEKWKNKELTRIKSLEKEKKLDDALREQLVTIKENRKIARERAKFTKKVGRDIVFSVLKSDSTELVVYNADTLGFFADGEADREYGVEDMRLYIKGQQAGRKHKVAFDVILGVAVGSISAGAGAYWGPSIPAGTVVFTSVFHNKIKNKAGVDPSLFDHDPFRDGYERAAKRKKAWSFVKGSIAGMGFGILMWDGFVRGEGLPGPR